MSGLSVMERIIVFGVCAMLLVFIGLTFTTAEWWLTLTRLEIEDACAGQPIPITYDRTFHRDFRGEWMVSIWRMEDAAWAAWDGTDGAWDYKPATPPRVRDLAWLVGNDLHMSTPPAGTYRVDVAVTANPGTIFSRTAKIESNPFEIMSCSN